MCPGVKGPLGRSAGCCEIPVQALLALDSMASHGNPAVLKAKMKKQGKRKGHVIQGPKKPVQYSDSDEDYSDVSSDEDEDPSDYRRGVLATSLHIT